ncbi:MAG: pitrilysin family protein [Pseudomonadota bacterium]
MSIKTFTLDNGMQVLLEENHAAKVVSFQALVKVGSANETDKEAGICHVIEHMLFKGTPTRPTGTIARDVEAAGGDINAYTSIDQTVYYINMATRFADKGLAILADAVKNPLFDADELAREAEVILEEIRREQDNPARMALERLFQEAYKVHTYGRPIIGYPHTVKSFTKNQLLDFHRRWYAPQNIAFIAVGDFKIDKMFEGIKEQFADFKGASAPTSKILPEPMHRSCGLTIKEMNIQSTYLSLGFNVPELTHPDIPAIDILAHILGGTESSRLEQEIKEKQRLVHNIYSFAFTPKHPGLCVIGAMLDDKDTARAIETLQKELQKLRDEPVTSEELSRAKLNIRSNEIYDKETVGGQAGKIASFLATAGSHEFEARYYQMIADVNAEKVRQVARKYLTPQNLSASLVVPNGSKWVSKPAEIIDAMTAPIKEPGVKKESTIERVQRIKLKNGATLLVIENHHLPVVSIYAAALGGTRFETSRTNGISELMARTMTKGTNRRSAVNIAKDIEAIAGHIDAFSGRNSCGVRCEFLSEHLHEGFEIFADVLTNPSFSSQEVSKERSILLKAIKDQEDALSTLAFAEFLKALFPKHPYGLRNLGTKESVRKLTAENLKRFHKSIMRAENMIITVAGDVNSHELTNLANEMLSNLPRGQAKLPRLKSDKQPTKPIEKTVTKREKQQAHIVIGFQGTQFKSPDHYAMTVLNNILSGQGGRLFRELRDKMSLAYAVSSLNQEGIEPGYFAVYIATEPAKVDTAVKGILAELEAIRTKKVDDEELNRSKQYLVGVYDLNLQRNGAIASTHTFNCLYGLPYDEVEKYPQKIMRVNADDVLKAAKKYINLDAYTMAVVRPA